MHFVDILGRCDIMSRFMTYRLTPSSKVSDTGDLSTSVDSRSSRACLLRSVYSTTRAQMRDSTRLVVVYAYVVGGPNEIDLQSTDLPRTPGELPVHARSKRWFVVNSRRPQQSPGRMVRVCCVRSDRIDSRNACSSYCTCITRNRRQPTRSCPTPWNFEGTPACLY